MGTDSRKQLGQYYTPPHVVASLAKWLLQSPTDTLLDPACGDGRFLQAHSQSTGIELCPAACEAARQRAPGARVLQTDFFTWAASAPDRFTAIGGNPPFIRYQNFSGDVRKRALALSRALGAEFSQLVSSWAPFVAAAAGLLKPGGRMGFVVPAEIGHATYAPTLLTALCRHFERVLVVAVRRKMFPHLAEDTWLLYAEGFGGSADGVDLAAVESFAFCATPPPASRRAPIREMAQAGARLRKHLLPVACRELYDRLNDEPWTRRVAEVADISIGYVTGANAFFHLTPAQARLWDVPPELTRVTVRRSEQLPREAVEPDTVQGWLQADLPVLLLTLPPTGPLPDGVRRYLDSAEAREARGRYKCRTRNPWYSVPGVVAPDGFLSVMCGRATSLVANRASCVCTNSVHTVRTRGGASLSRLQEAWTAPLSRLSQEIEGHPLGGGMLKLEPREAGRVVIPWMDRPLARHDLQLLHEGIDCARGWRHVA